MEAGDPGAMGNASAPGRDRRPRRTHRVALPFPKLHLRGPRPREFPRGYPREVHTLGDQVRKRRLDQSLTQRNLAEMLGVSIATVGMWENDRCRPLPRYHRPLSEVLGCDRMIGWPDPRRPGEGRLELGGVRRVAPSERGATARGVGHQPGELGSHPRREPRA
jgi:DNA-binding XRE family transcriptional regulator